MHNSTLSALSSAQSVVPVNTDTTNPSQQPTININLPKLPASFLRDPNLIEVGGGIIPGFKCSRQNLMPTFLTISGIIGVFFTVKYGVPYIFSKVDKDKDEEEGHKPNPPTVKKLSECLNSGGEPKPPIIPDILYFGGRTILAGRTGVGKSLLLDQMCIEVARGYGEFVDSEHSTPQHVILIDGEMEDDDYKRRFPKDLAGTENITRVSDCEFKTIKEFTDFVKELVAGLSVNTVVAIDNIAAFFPNPTAAMMFEFYGNLKKIQREASITISYIIADHVAKVPVGFPLDESHLAGSANTTRFATNVVILDWDARGSDYRFLKNQKQRKNALPNEVLELVIDESEFLHFSKFGNAAEEDVLWTKTNRKRFGQEVEDDNDDEGNESTQPPKDDLILEEARSMKALSEQGLTQDEIASRFDCSRRTVNNRFSLLKSRGEM